jgi:hypothetical protein
MEKIAEDTIRRYQDMGIESLPDEERFWCGNSNLRGVAILTGVKSKSPSLRERLLRQDGLRFIPEVCEQGLGPMDQKSIDETIVRSNSPADEVKRLEKFGVSPPESAVKQWYDKNKNCLSGDQHGTWQMRELRKITGIAPNLTREYVEGLIFGNPVRLARGEKDPCKFYSEFLMVFTKDKELGAILELSGYDLSDDILICNSRKIVQAGYEGGGYGVKKLLECVPKPTGHIVDSLFDLYLKMWRDPETYGRKEGDTCRPGYSLAESLKNNGGLTPSENTVQSAYKHHLEREQYGALYGIGNFTETRLNPENMERFAALVQNSPKWEKFRVK